MQIEKRCTDCGGTGENHEAQPELTPQPGLADPRFEYPNCPHCEGSGWVLRNYGSFNPSIALVRSFIFPNGLKVAKDGTIISPSHLGQYQVGLRVGMPLVDPSKVSLD